MKVRGFYAIYEKKAIVVAGLLEGKELKSVLQVLLFFRRIYLVKPRMTLMKILADQIILEKSRGEDRKYRIVMVPRKVRSWLIRLYWRNPGEKTGNTGLLWYPER